MEEKSIYMVSETTGGSPSASVTYYYPFSTPEEAEREQASFEEDQNQLELDHADYWHRSRLFEIAESDLEYWLSRSGRQ